MGKGKPLVISPATVHKEIQALISFVVLNKVYTKDSKKTNKLEDELFDLYHSTFQNGSDKTLSFVQQFVQAESTFEGAYEEVIDISARMEAEKEGKPLKFTLKNAMTFGNKTFVVSTTAAGAPLNPKTLRQSFMGGKGEALLQGRTIKELASDAYNNFKKAQSLIKQHKLLNDDGTLKSGTNDVDEVFKKLLHLLIDHLSEAKEGEEPTPTETDFMEQASFTSETDSDITPVESEETGKGQKQHDEMFVRGWMSIILFSPHIGYMWDSVKDLDLPMVMNEDYEGREKLDFSVGRDGNDSQVSAIAGVYKQVNEK
jgi:hypothetical protein